MEFKGEFTAHFFNVEKHFEQLRIDHFGPRFLGPSCFEAPKPMTSVAALNA